MEITHLAVALLCSDDGFAAWCGRQRNVIRWQVGCEPQGQFECWRREQMWIHQLALDVLLINGVATSTILTFCHGTYWVHWQFNAWWQSFITQLHVYIAWAMLVYWTGGWFWLKSLYNYSMDCCENLHKHLGSPEDQSYWLWWSPDLHHHEVGMWNFSPTIFIYCYIINNPSC